jgi:hypothetical protein
MTQFDSIFAALQAAGTRYVVVGGVAVNLHGYQRFTKDLDLVIELVPERALKALEALQAIGYRPNVPVKLSDFADPAVREAWIRDKGMLVFQMYNAQARMSIDIFVKYPLDFEELWSQGMQVELATAAPRIASIDHLIQATPRGGKGAALVSDELDPPAGSFEAAELFHLRTALESTPQQRLQDLQDMIDFNAEAEARNPHLRRIAELLRE